MIRLYTPAGSDISIIDYDRTSLELTVAYKTDETYVYLGVPDHVFEELLAAVSESDYVREVIQPNYGRIKQALKTVVLALPLRARAAKIRRDNNKRITTNIKVLK